MSNVSQYSTSASSNNSAAPDGAPEGWAPSDVNNWGREVMAALARWYQDTQGSLVTAGTGNAYTLASNSSHAALADQSMLVFRVDRANTGAATLAVDGLAAKSLVKADGSALASDDLQANSLAAVAYNANQDKYFLLSPPKLGTAANKGSASTTAEGTVELATSAETQTGTDPNRAVTPAGLDSRTATTSRTGLVEKSTSAENTGGTATDKFPDVAGVKEMIDNSVDLVLLSSASASSSSEITFTGIDSTYDVYQLVYSNVQPSSVSALKLRTSSDGGSTYDSGASDYDWQGRALEIGQAETGPEAANDDAIDLSSTVTEQSGNIFIYNAANSAVNTMFRVDSVKVDASDAVIMSETVGRRKENAIVDAVQFTFETGNILTGEFQLYGLRKS